MILIFSYKMKHALSMHAERCCVSCREIFESIDIAKNHHLMSARHKKCFTCNIGFENDIDHLEVSSFHIYFYSRCLMRDIIHVCSMLRNFTLSGAKFSRMKRLFPSPGQRRCRCITVPRQAYVQECSRYAQGRVIYL